MGMTTAAATRDLFQPAEALAGSIRRRQVSPLELMEATLARIDAVNPSLNAIVELDAERGLREAREQTERLARGEDLGPLGGLPFAVKDLENAAGFHTTSGSRAYADRVADRDDVHVARLRAAGAICIGKTNTPEFGYTAVTTNEVYGTTRNPWNLERTPGGSSGGAAAAIASGMLAVATASDGGGSIRIPACFVGAFGLKPTFGLVPITPGEMLPWMDTSCYGPLTRTVRDAAIYLDAVAGADPSDPTSLAKPPSFLAALDEPLPRLRIAFNRTLGFPAVQRDVARQVELAARDLSDMGHVVEENDDPIEPLLGYWRVLGRFQALAGFDDLLLNRRDLLSPGYAAGLDGIEATTWKDFGDAYRARARLVQWLAGLWQRHDLLIAPTMPVEAYAAEGPMPNEIEGVRLGRNNIANFTAPFNFSGNPAATVRAGFTDAGLPAGLQIVGPRHADALVLRLAHEYEQARPWNDRWPEVGV
jgi:aspartyl-tRNA(Asn)/glutamyl-tRNA(Gln) amidotransferase subunit A